MFKSPTEWIIVAALVLAVTIIRSVIASRRDNETRKQAESRQSGYEDRLRNMAKGAEEGGLKTVLSGESALGLDEKNGLLYVVCSALTPEELSIPLRNVVSVSLVDHSFNYRQSQEMARLRTGVERKSIYMPYGKNSAKSVKEGQRQFEAYRGQIILGVDIRCREDKSYTVPCFRGDGSMFWYEDKLLSTLRQFISDTNVAIHRIRTDI